MKKRFSIIAVAVLCAALVGVSAGCSSSGSSIDYSGTWAFSAMQDEDGTITTSESLDSTDMSAADLAYLELGSDGSVQFVIMGSDMFEGTDATWSATDTGIQIEDSSGDAYPVTYNEDDGTLEIESDGQIIWFAKVTETDADDSEAADDSTATEEAETADDAEATDETSDTATE